MSKTITKKTEHIHYVRRLRIYVRDVFDDFNMLFAREFLILNGRIEDFLKEIRKIIGKYAREEE